MVEKDTIFKINGERNSGTGFLWQLFKKNFPHYKLSHESCNGISTRVGNGKIINVGWKHGEPTYLDEYKRMFPTSKIINFFVVRDLESWLISFFNNPYHVVRKPNIKSFLTTKQVIAKSNMNNIIDFKTKKKFNYLDEGRDIFEIRYYKLDKYMEFFNKEEHVVIVPLEYLQNNTTEFLNKVTEFYNLKMEETPVVNLKHVKNKNKTKNRDYKVTFTNEEKEIILNKRNDKLEEFFNEFKIK